MLVSQAMGTVARAAEEEMEEGEVTDDGELSDVR